MVNDSNLLSVVILCKSSKKELIGTIDSVLAQEGVRIELVIGSNGCWLDMQEELLINHINARRTDKLERVYIENKTRPIAGDLFLDSLLEECRGRAVTLLKSGETLSGRDALKKNGGLPRKEASAEHFGEPRGREDKNFDPAGYRYDMLAPELSRRARVRKLIASAYGFCSAFSAVEAMAVSLTVNLIAISILLIGSFYPIGMWTAIAEVVFYGSASVLIVQAVLGVIRKLRAAASLLRRM